VYPRAFICGLSGFSLSKQERRFLAKARPAGVALFKRNVEDPEQLRRLTNEIRDTASANGRTLILVDQEGGRVQRLSGPHWRLYPAARAFGQMYRVKGKEALQTARLCAQMMASDLHSVGINTACAPVLDVPVPGADNVIGDRAYADDPETVTLLGRAVAEGLLAGGVLPVMKHIPGHGRAMADSHLALPVVHTPLAELKMADFAPFRALHWLPMAMTAHVTFTAIDPSVPITISKRAIDAVIRGEIGFTGLLMSDDLSMGALTGSLDERARACLEAGCDLALHCNGNMREMEEVAGASPVLEGPALDRFEAALAQLKAPTPFDAHRAELARTETLAAIA